MRTNEIAKLTNVHPNTVRLYEEWGYISPVPRQENGYRTFSQTHLLQMKIARLAFKQEFIQNNLRKMATRIVQLSGKEQFSEALEEAKNYLSYLNDELSYTTKAVHLAQNLLHPKKTNDIVYTHKEIAIKIQLTEDTLRNWERNGLYSIKRDAQQRRLYTEADLQTLYIIRTLRSAHFSIASIHQFLQAINTVENVHDIHTLLNTPKFVDEFLHVTDELEINLNKAMKDVKSIITLIQSRK
jgi:DNA-binding transcriptional MerR regulator